MQTDRGASVASAASSSSRRAWATAMVVGSVVLGACGQKGPLTLPAAPRASAPPAAPPAATPASAPQPAHPASAPR